MTSSPSVFMLAAQHQLPQPRRTLQPVARQLQVADALVAVEFSVVLTGSVVMSWVSVNPMPENGT